MIVKAFGKALSDGFELKDHLNKYQFSNDDLSRFNDGQTPSVAVEVALTQIPLPISNKFEYGGQGSGFQNIKDQDCIIKLINCTLSIIKNKQNYPKLGWLFV